MGQKKKRVDQMKTPLVLFDIPMKHIFKESKLIYLFLILQAQYQVYILKNVKIKSVKFVYFTRKFSSKFLNKWRKRATIK